MRSTGCWSCLLEEARRASPKPVRLTAGVGTAGEQPLGPPHSAPTSFPWVKLQPDPEAHLERQLELVRVLVRLTRKHPGTSKRGAGIPAPKSGFSPLARAFITGCTYLPTALCGWMRTFVSTRFASPAPGAGVEVHRPERLAKDL
jgi:hypothetical protein